MTEGRATTQNMETRLGVDKIKLFGWTVKDSKGSLQYISKHNLLVDRPNYQRDLTESKVLNIAGKWSWVACSVLVVARRQDGDMFVIDGGHRLAASLRRSDIHDLPCIVFSATKIEEEAQGFLDIQVNRKNINSRDKFRALLTVGDPDAIFVRDLISESGRHASGASNGQTVSCLTSLINLANKHRATLTRVWPLMVELCRDKPIHNDLLTGLECLERHLNMHGDSLVGTKWTDRILRIGEHRLLQSIRRATAFHGKGSGPIRALGITRELNHGLRDRMPEIEINQRTETNGES